MMKKATAMNHLPPLPIIVDHSDGACAIKAGKRMFSALAYPDQSVQVSERRCSIYLSCSRLHGSRWVTL
jgi:hypothetical protein